MARKWVLVSEMNEKTPFIYEERQNRLKEVRATALVSIDTLIERNVDFFLC